MKFARIALLPLTLTAVPANAAEIQIAVQNPVVELQINEVVRCEPDTAVIGASVTTRAATAAEAMRQNAVKMNRVIERLRSLGIPRGDIQTSNFNLNANYQPVRTGGPPSFLGYDAVNQVNVTLRDLDKIGTALDALATAGANGFYGPNFMLEQDHAAKGVARSRAFARAQAQAAEYAKMAGYGNTRLLEVAEAYSAMGPVAVVGNASDVVATAQAKELTPVEPGKVGTSVLLTAKFEMLR